MRRFICFLSSVWVNIRYFNDGLRQGYVLDGHDLVGNGEVCGDHWHVVCQRCGLVGGIDVDPARWSD